ncbi:ABC transporter substrate-binding protein [Pacificibacter marinus]|uniref:ABC transporter substrate-binding protein n=1 Tax=Pacificibacter marinus TaxID=658057 RepID=UPI001C07912F|nr:ABC transporter substrate-binding protein [Pacificibacter marinus]MBU2867289.1 ABC transporter substrate-binding protein [Pacificibacter marinus]
MRIKSKLISTIAAAAFLAAAGTASADGVLRLGQTATLPNLNPFVLAPASEPMVNNLYDTLTRYDANMSPEPRLAESWEFSDDGLTLTMKLRDGVTFHSGKAFTSADVKASMDYVLDPANGALIRGFAERVISLETPDDHTVVMTFEEPFPGVFDLFELFFIVDGDTASDFSQTANGTGPFKVASHEPGTLTRLDRNDAYWNGAPSLDAVEIVTSPNQQAELLALKSGELDLVTELGWIDVLPFSRDENFTTGSAPSGVAHDLSLNLKVPALQNPLVREAIDLSLDRERIAQLFFGPEGTTWCLPYNPNSIAYVAEYDNCEYDLDKARAALEASGETLPIELKILTSTEIRTEYTTIAEILQADLAKVGINLSIENVDAVGYRSTYVDERSYEIASHAFGRAGKDPSALLETTVVFRPDGNITGYENPAYAASVKAGGSTPVLEERKAAYKEVARIFREDRFVLPIIPRVRLFVSQDEVNDIGWSADGFAIFEKATISE